MPAPLLRRSLWTLALAAGLVVLIVLALPYAASTRLVRDRIAHEMSEWSGFEVSIGAPPEITVWPDLQANLTNVTLSLPGGMGKMPAITAERVEIELSALAALGGSVEFSRARFIRPRILIEGAPAVPALLAALPRGGRIAQAIGTARQIVAEDRAAPDTARLPGDAFGVVEFSDGTIVAVSNGAETEIATGLAGKVGWEALNGRANAAATGVWRGEQFSVDAASANPLLFFGGAATQITASLKSAPANLSFDGTASLGENPYAEGRVRFSAPSMRKMFEWSGAGLPDGSAIGAIALDGHILGDPGRVRFENVEIKLDGQPARGALDLIMAGKLPMVAGTLAFHRLDLTSFLSAFTPLDASAGEGPGIIDADFAGRFNLDLRLSAAQATIGPIMLADVAATVRVDEGLAAFDLSDASAFGGNFQAGLRFDRKAEGSLVEMRLLASDVDGGAFAAAAGMTRLAPIGRGTVSIILKGDGSSWNALLAHANGSFSASFGQGALSGINLEALVARSRTGDPFTLEAVAGDASPIDALELKANFADGVASIEKAEVRSPLNRIALAGSARLAGGSLDLSARIQPQQQAAAGTPDPGNAATFLVGGSWSAPVFTPTTDLSAE